jgi:hypothetical protein
MEKMNQCTVCAQTVIHRYKFKVIHHSNSMFTHVGGFVRTCLPLMLDHPCPVSFRTFTYKMSATCWDNDEHALPP